MTSENTLPNDNIDRDVVTRHDVQSMISEQTYSKPEIDGKLKTHTDRVDELKSRMQDKADNSALDKLQGIVMRLEAQITALGDTTRTLPLELKTAFEAESKRKSEMYEIQLANVTGQIQTMLQGIERLITKTEKQDAQHDALAERVNAVEINDAETRNANATAWARIQTALYGDDKDDEDKGLVGKINRIDKRLVWVDNRRAIERFFARVFTSKPFLYVLGAVLGGGGTLALLSEILS